MKKLLIVPLAIGATESLDTLSDPDRAEGPPYLPDSPRTREIWVHMYDLLAVFDKGVGDLIEQLEEDGLLDDPSLGNAVPIRGRYHSPYTFNNHFSQADLIMFT